MKVLVTGGTGYIGSHTALGLLAAGHEVVLFDNLSNSWAGTLGALGGLACRRVPFVEGDIRDRAALDRVFGAGGFEAVVHLAALKSAAASVADPGAYHDHNVAGTAALVGAMAARGVRTLLFGSSVAVYRAGSAPHAEGSPKGPASPYGRTKLLAERLLEDAYAADPRWRIAVLRYANVAGAHASGRLGEDPRGEPANLLPRIGRVALGIDRELEVYAGGGATPDGSSVRDYVHVADVARAHAVALVRLDAGPGAWVVNVGSGRGWSVLQVVRAYARAAGRDIPYRLAGVRPGDAPVVRIDSRRARELLGWRPSAGLERICADCWRWQSAHGSHGGGAAEAGSVWSEGNFAP